MGALEWPAKGEKTSMFYNIEFVKERFQVPLAFEGLEINRRSLLASTALLAIASATVVGPVGAWAVAGFTADQRLALIRMSRDIYPHDGFLSDEPYIKVVDGVLAEAKTNPATRKLVMGGLDDLAAHANEIYGKDYVAISDAFKREGLLRSIEHTDFFQRFRGELLMGIYNNKSLWPKFGYDGSSWENGGFMDSFDKIDWL